MEDTLLVLYTIYGSCMFTIVRNKVRVHNFVRFIFICQLGGYVGVICGSLFYTCVNTFHVFVVNLGVVIWVKTYTVLWA